MTVFKFQLCRETVEQIVCRVKTFCDMLLAFQDLIYCFYFLFLQVEKKLTIFNCISRNWKTTVGHILIKDIMHDDIYV